MSAPAEPWRCSLCEATLAGTIVRISRSDRKVCTWCEAELARTGRKRCRMCSVAKPLDAFYRRAASSDGRHARCSECLSPVDTQRRAEYYQAHKEEICAARRAQYAIDKANGQLVSRTRPRNTEQERAYRLRPERQAKQRQYNAAWNARNAEKQRGYSTAAKLRRKLRLLRQMRGQV